MKKRRRRNDGRGGMAGRMPLFTTGLFAGACLLLLACTVETDFGPDGLKELQEGQKAILERIEKK